MSWIEDIWKFIKFIPNAFTEFRANERLRKDCEKLQKECSHLAEENKKMKDALDIKKGLSVGKYGAMWSQDEPSQPYCTKCVVSGQARSPLIREGQGWRCIICGEAYNWSLPPNFLGGGL